MKGNDRTAEYEDVLKFTLIADLKPPVTEAKNSKLFSIEIVKDQESRLKIGDTFVYVVTAFYLYPGVNPYDISTMKLYTSTTPITI